MYAFAPHFNWPMKVDGKLFTTDIPLRSMLAEIWLFESSEKFYRTWEEGVKCGRIIEVYGTAY